MFALIDLNKNRFLLQLHNTDITTEIAKKTLNNNKRTN